MKFRSTSLLVEISLDRPMPRADARDSSEPRDSAALRRGTDATHREVVHLQRAGVADDTILSVRFTRPMVLGPRMRIVPAAWIINWR